MIQTLLGKARGVQRRLESYYGLESGPDVTRFVRQGGVGSRETVLVRQGAADVELAVILPPQAEARRGVFDWDMQVVEGVSHFVHLAERARTELPTTQLELELQAEVDKFVVLALSQDDVMLTSARSLHRALYQHVRQLHSPESAAGHRYRLANRLAARLAARLLNSQDRSGARRTLQRFYRAGQTDKIRLALG